MTVPVWVRGTFLLVVTLIAGIAIGMAYERHRVPLHAVVGSHHVMQRLKRDLELDSTQEKAIEVILARRQVTVDSTWRAMQPRVHAAMDSTLREIVAVLRPDQMAKYRKMIEAHHPGTLR